MCARSGKCLCYILVLARMPFDRGNLFEDISGSVGAATTFIKTPQRCRGYCNPFIDGLGKLLVIAKLKCGVFKITEGVTVNFRS